jgi:CrcB protein
LLWALGSISLHVVGSLAMTAAGLLSFQMIGSR